MKWGRCLTQPPPLLQRTALLAPQAHAVTWPCVHALHHANCRCALHAFIFVAGVVTHGAGSGELDMTLEVLPMCAVCCVLLKHAFKSAHRVPPQNVRHCSAAGSCIAMHITPGTPLHTLAHWLRLRQQSPRLKLQNHWLAAGSAHRGARGDAAACG